MGAVDRRTRRRFGRTLSRARWCEYRRLLALALGQGYEIVPVEAWLARRGAAGAGDGSAVPAREAGSKRDVAATIILRHDVDQCPRSALRMAAIEQEFGVRSTWYFRWRTAHPEVVGAIRAAGHEVGLHYETLTRELLRCRLSSADAPAVVPRARTLLRAELAAFAARHGSARSTCPHGDTRVPGVHNGVLLDGEDLASYGIEWEANAAVGRTRLDVWLTDRSRAEGSWKDSLDPIDLLIDRRSPILAVVHPNNWVSGPALWRDRVAPGRLGTARTDTPPLRTDAQPLTACSAAR